MTHFQKTASTMDMDDCALIMDKVRCMKYEEVGTARDYQDE